MARIIGEVNKKFPFFKDFYYLHYGTFKYAYLLSKHRLGILRPLWVQWLMTYECNLKCGHCEANAGAVKSEEVSTSQICDTINDIADLGTKKFSFSGGEPLMREDLFEVIRYLKSKEIYYGLNSNCFLAECHNREFEKCPPDWLFTSIDGIEDSHDEFRGAKGAFRKTLDTIGFFKGLGVKSITVNTFVYSKNIRELDDLKDTIINSGATFWRISIAIPVGRAKANEEMYLNNDQTERLFKFIYETRKGFNIEITEDAGYLGCWDKALKKRPFFCGAGFTRCSIMPDGEVLGCQIAYDSKYSEGNIKEKPFAEIWKTGFERFRHPEHDGCIGCRYFHACRGGCWGMRLGNRHCLKEVWENDKFNCQACI